MFILMQLSEPKENGIAVLFYYSVDGSRFSIHYLFEFVEGVPGIFILMLFKIIIEGLDD